MKITEIKDGRQARPYADHIWEWDIVTDKSEAEVLDYCRKELRNAQRDETTYWKDYRDRNKSFNEHMEIVCGGYFNLNKTENGYRYRVTLEYID